MRNKYITNVKPKLNLIKALRRDGATEEMIFKQLDVGHSAWAEYKKKHPELMDALKESKAILIARIEDSLFNQAIKGNMTAIIFSLKNLNGSKWRDRQEVGNGNNESKEFIESLDRFAEAMKQ